MEKKHKRQTLGGKRKKSEYLHKNNKHRIKAKIKEKKKNVKKILQHATQLTPCKAFEMQHTDASVYVWVYATEYLTTLEYKM